MNRPRSLGLLLAAAVGAACLLGVPGRSRDAPDTLPFASLDAFIKQAKTRVSRKGTGKFAEPSADERRRFAAGMEKLLDGDFDAARECLDRLGYDVAYLDDSDRDKMYIVARERKDAFRGQGTYIVDPRYARNAVVAVPHPLYDSGTPREGGQIFQALGARALFIAGAHRCTSERSSTCPGTTSACGGGRYKISDAAHNTRTFFQAAHEAALSLSPPPYAWSLHGKSSDSIAVVLSDGTRRPAPRSARVNRLRSILIAGGVRAASCNWPADEGLRLCGGTNTQGRLYNGSADPCAKAAARSSGRFLHLEQSRAVRKDPAALIAALKRVFPPEKKVPGT